MSSTDEGESHLDPGNSAESMAVDDKSAEDGRNPSSLPHAKRMWMEAGWDIDEGLSIYPISPALREELLTGRESESRGNLRAVASKLVDNIPNPCKDAANKKKTKGSEGYVAKSSDNSEKGTSSSVVLVVRHSCCAQREVLYAGLEVQALLPFFLYADMRSILMVLLHSKGTDIMLPQCTLSNADQFREMHVGVSHCVCVCVCVCIHM